MGNLPRLVRAAVLQAAESGHMPDPAIRLAEVVRVEAPLVEDLAAPRTPVVVLTAAVDLHDLAFELEAGIEALATPVVAPAWNPERARRSPGVADRPPFVMSPKR
jgi:hypothetical protein